MLACIAEAEATILHAEVHFGDERVFDIGPYVVWGMMKKKMAPFMSGGKMQRPVQKVLEAVGLDRYMDIALSTKNDGVDIWSFPLVERRASGSSRDKDQLMSPPTFSKIADELVNTVNAWLLAVTPPLELTEFGMANINNLTTEILNNAERHARLEGDGEWVIAGFMARRPLASPVNGRDAWYDCHLAFVSMGCTISETISHAEEDWVRDGLAAYVLKHERGLFGGCFDRDDLATVFAMQDGISRFRPERSNGGVGMMEVVDFANELGQTGDAEHQPVVSIVSGSTCILFRNRFGCGKPSPDGKRIQWFNDQNSPEAPPDPSHVITLKHRIPGTIISVRFSLDGQALAKVGENENQPERVD